VGNESQSIGDVRGSSFGFNSNEAVLPLSLRYPKSASPLAVTLYVACLASQIFGAIENIMGRDFHPPEWYPANSGRKILCFGSVRHVTGSTGRLCIISPCVMTVVAECETVFFVGVDAIDETRPPRKGTEKREALVRITP
jgi:hypothetical protein